jgi:FixJ family two-component response regulator
MPNPSTDQCLVAIVDDEFSVRKGLSNLLKSAGYLTECFPSGESFLASDRHASFNYLILDIQLGGMNGFEVRKCLADSGVDIPFIIVSAFEDSLTRKRALECGAALFLPKPIDVDALLSDIQVTLAARGGRR